MAQQEEGQRDEGQSEDGVSIREAEQALLGMFTEEPADDGGDLDQNRRPDPRGGSDEDDIAEEDDSDGYEDDFEGDDEDAEGPEEESEGEYEDDDALNEDPDPDAKPTYKVKVAGDEVEVTLDEALSGYMRQQDYTQKTMEVAETRKAIRAAEEELLAMEQEYEQNLQLVGQVLTGGLGDDPDWNAVKQAHPKDWKNIRDAWLERQDQVKTLKGELNRVRQSQKEIMERRKAALLAEEQDKLRAAIPEWVDPEVAKSEVEKIVRTGRFYGIDPEEFQNLTDHRIILVLRDAMRAREMDNAAEEGKQVRRKTRRKSKTLKPGTRKTKSTPSSTKTARAARKRLAQSGNIRDAEAALLGILG